MTKSCEGCKYKNDPMHIGQCITCQRYYNRNIMLADLYEPSKPKKKDENNAVY